MTSEEESTTPDLVVDLGNGVALAVLHQGGRPSGSTGEVQPHYASVTAWANGLMTRVTDYRDIDEARAVAERLVEERA